PIWLSKSSWSRSSRAMAPQGFDTISLNRASGECVLTLIDHLPWDARQLVDLQRRNTLCLRTIEGRELFRSPRAAADGDFVIPPRCIDEPDAASGAFVEQAGEMLDEAGYRLRYGPLASAYADASA